MGWIVSLGRHTRGIGGGRQGGSGGARGRMAFRIIISGVKSTTRLEVEEPISVRLATQYAGTEQLRSAVVGYGVALASGKLLVLKYLLTPQNRFLVYVACLRI